MKKLQAKLIETVHSIKIPGIIKTILINLLIPSHYLSIKLHNKLFLQCDARDYRSAELLRTGFYELVMTNVFYKFLNEGDTVFDFGANIGYFSVLSSAIVGNAGKVYSFEPIHENCQLLEASRQINALNNIEINEIFCGEVTDVEITMSLPSAGNSGIGSLAVPLNAATTTVKTITLDDFCVRNGIPSVDFLKMDIEGGEGVAIRGMFSGLRNHLYKIVAVEFHPMQLQTLGEDSHALKEVFVRHGYHAFELVPPSKLINRTYTGLNGGYMIFISPTSKYFNCTDITVVEHNVEN